ncbi:MAG: TOBE domain-containing protein [Pseudomonas sp.]|uniref:TOBE domain-containing protein n=1 Tax=Pseudomonas sp. TaxID=306 RepID=UPI003392DD33
MSLLTSLAQHGVRRPQRMALLAQIAEQGSITRAAKAAGLSYKAAWDAIDELNNLAETPLVERSVGGRGGGGARLSAEGERLLALYQRLEALQAQVLADADNADLQQLGRLLLRTSARNQLSGRVLTITAQGGNDLLQLELPGGAQVQAQITHPSTEKLELMAGSPVVALIKAGWLTLHAPHDPPAPGLNRLDGRIEQIVADDADRCEVRIVLANGQTLCAQASPTRLAELALGEGDAVCTGFSPEQVLLGTQL